MYYGKWINRFLHLPLRIYPVKKKHALLLALMAWLVFTPFSLAPYPAKCLPGKPHFVMESDFGYFLWHDDKGVRLNWRKVGKEGTKQECLDYIDEVWTDMRPLSLRRTMEKTEGESKEEIKPIDLDKVEKLDIDAAKKWISYLEWLVKVGEFYLEEDPEIGKCFLSQIQKGDLDTTRRAFAYSLGRQWGAVERSERRHQYEKAKRLNVKINALVAVRQTPAAYDLAAEINKVLKEELEKEFGPLMDKILGDEEKIDGRLITIGLQAQADKPWDDTWANKVVTGLGRVRISAVYTKSEVVAEKGLLGEKEISKLKITCG